jgi:hypothetical protein
MCTRKVEIGWEENTLENRLKWDDNTDKCLTKVGLEIFNAFIIYAGHLGLKKRVDYCGGT